MSAPVQTPAPQPNPQQPASAQPPSVQLTPQVQQQADELARAFTEIFTDIANLAVSFGLVDVVALVEEVDGGKELVQNIRKLLKDFKKIQDLISKQAPQRPAQPQTQPQA